MAEIKVSVILTTCDRAALVSEALASVLEQSRPPAEIIVVDDGSADETEERLRPLAGGVHYLRNPQPLGVSAARNRGIRAAAGNWLAFLDSDDLWKPAKLERQLQALREHPGYRICYTDEEWRRDGRWMNQGARHRKRSGWIYTDCLPLCIISPSSVLIERGLLEQTGLFDEALPACEDYDLWLRIASRVPVLFVPERLIVKRAGEWPQLSRQHSLDRYRIIALAGIAASGGLGAADLAATTAMLAEKCRIYALGCRKHGRTEEAEWAENMASGRAGLTQSPIMEETNNE
ncbi:MAG: UDP-Glc:alpha-D-GlcNAc-diphosphoundecaprenol beta-1,3-glucosyltransferase WfgD [bacterium ADurb.Bin431]|nr:MAG: UDP-Glc:alpha-D-GlcNAc-diphosphoundecaprenol beta-1,3-glucosyltransferase WfgD [bacterium ADurb.Bin431]HNY90271.1 glycosyltransferase family A protein [bacterium]HOH06847.1 glycosyltransferase family A protein [bacterium]HOY45039.1 glycosyltransferase family A protein [bacterium]HPG82814.1 glycosyltransferase family A protein [bacterium]